MDEEPKSLRSAGIRAWRTRQARLGAAANNEAALAAGREWHGRVKRAVREQRHAGAVEAGKVIVPVPLLPEVLVFFQEQGAALRLPPEVLIGAALYALAYDLR